MKLKYYLRGLGIGIIITTIILMIAYAGNKTELTDVEIIERAQKLGMVMKEDPLFPGANEDKTTENTETSETIETVDTMEIVDTTEALESTEIVESTEIIEDTEVDTQLEIETETEVEQENEIEIQPEVSTEQYHLVIPSGSVPRLICNELEEQGVVESASALRQYLVDVGFATSISVGEYDIPYGATNEEVYQILKAGPIKR